MHRRYVSGSAAEGDTERVLLQKRASTHGALARTKSTSYAVPSRFRADAAAYHSHESASAGTTSASHSRSGKSLSEDQIVCQSKLYDAFELQELEQHLDRKLSFRNDRETRSISILSSGQESLSSQKSLRSVPTFLNDHTSITADHLRERSVCDCNFCNSDVQNPSLSSLINGSSLPRSTQSVTTVSDIVMEPAYLQAEAGWSSKQPGADKNDPSQDDNHASYAPTRCVSRAYYDGVSAGPAHIDGQELEALQGLREYADHYAMSSTTNTLKGHKQRRAKSGRWPLVNSLIRSLPAIRKEENNMVFLKEARALPSTSTNIPRQQWNKEYHHYHHVVHYHHVHHHHHHHVVNAVHFEEIDWPLSPARLEELGWLMSDNCHKTKDL